MIRKIGVLVILAVGLIFTAKGQAPSSAFVYTINGDTCAPSTPNTKDSMYATFTAKPSQTGVTYKWNFGSSGIAAQTGPNVDVYFKKSGSFTVILTAINSTGDSSKTSKTVTIKCRPVISFSVSDSMGCSPLSTTLKATSSGCTGTDKFHMYFGGLKYNGATLTKSFTALGYYHPSIDISDTFSNGCVATYHKDTFLRVSPKPSITFTPTPASTCKSPDTVKYTNTSSGGFGTYNPPISYKWTFTSGSPSSSTIKSPSIIYTGAGSYDVKLVATNLQTGCKDSLTKTSAVTVLTTPTSSITTSATSVCQCGTFTLNWTGTPTPSSVTWTNSGKITIASGTSTNVTVPCNDTLLGSQTFTGTPTFSNGCSATAQTVTVTLHAKPTVKYVVSDTTAGCKLPRVDTFTSKPCISGATYNWLFSPGACTKLAGAGTCKFIITYSCPGKYPYPVLNVTSGGCANQFARNDSLEIDSMKAVISTNNTGIFSGVCTPLKVKFTGDKSLGTPTPNSFSWTLYDSTGKKVDTTGTSDSLIHKFVGCGKKYLKLYVKNSLGCSDTVKQTLYTGQKTAANIVVHDSFRCYHDSISFSTNTVFSCKPTGLFWYINWPKYTAVGSGNKFKVSSLDTGYHRIALVTSNNGCLDTIVYPERILVKGPKIKTKVTPSCKSDIIKIDVGKKATGSILGKTIKWFDGVSGKEYTYFRNDTTIYDTALCTNKVFQIYFIDTLGTRVCIDSLPYGGYLTVLHRHLIMADTLLSPATSCYPYTLKIKNSSSSCGVDPDISSYLVRVYRNCGNSFSFYTNLYNSSGGYFRTGDTITTSALLPGRYKFTVVGFMGSYNYPNCVDSIKLPGYITIYGVKAGFKDTVAVTSGCGPLKVALVDTSSATCGISTITSYKYNIYAPGSSTVSVDSFNVKNPPVFYLHNPGCYSMQYKIKDNHGCIDSAFVSNYVCVVKPAVSFTVSQDSVCGKVSLSFTSTASITGSLPLTYVWDFGNGDTSHALNPSYIYIDSSTFGGPSFKLYHIKLDVSTGSCDSVFEHDVYVSYPHITLDISPNTPQKCPPVFATIICTNPKDALIYDWNYDNPNPSTEVVTTSPSDSIFPVYNYPGNYDIHLTVVTKGGCVDTITEKSPITIYGPKLASKSVTPKLGCIPLSVQLKAFSPGPIKYQWKQTKDSAKVSSTGDSIYFIYKSRGKFLTYVAVTDTTQHCTVLYPLDTVTIATPTAKFGIDDTVICSGQLVHFSDSSKTTTYLTGHVWNFGDGGTATSSNASHIFTTNTTKYFTIQLISTAYPGCNDTTTRKILVYAPPAIKMILSDSNVCPGTTIHFTDSSTGTITSRKWNYGSGSTFTGTTSTSHIYDTSGTFYAKLVILAGTGCIDSVIKTITVYKLPPVNAGADTSICIGTSAHLHASGASTYIWRYIASSDSTKSNPVVSPTVTTKYHLIGTDIHSCIDTSSINVTVNSLPVVSLGGNKPLCIYDSIVLSPTVTGGQSPYSYLWTPSTVLSSSTGSSVYAKPLKSVRISVLVTDFNKCKNTDTMTMKVNSLPVVSAGNDTGVCIGFCAMLKATGATKYVWTPGNDSTASYIVCPTPPSLYTYTVIGTDTNNCKATSKVIVTVHPKPTISGGLDKTICRDSSVTLKATGGKKYVWAPNDTTINNDTIISPKVKPSVTSTYTVTGTDVYGCVDSGIVKITVIQRVHAIAIPADTTVCFDRPFLLKASGGIFYRWTPVAGLSNPFDSSTIVTLKKDQIFKVLVSNQCFSDTADVNIHVQPLPTVTVTPRNSFVSTGESVTLTATGSGVGVYSWLPNTGITSGQNTSVVMVSPQVNTTYTVTFGSGPCIVADSAVVTLKCEGFRLPNLFTPDQAQNNYFHPIKVSLAQLKSFRVYDRWGNLMYSTSDVTDNGWDGTRKGAKCEQGVYVYYIEAVCTTGEIIRTQGNITLLR